MYRDGKTKVYASENKEYWARSLEEIMYELAYQYGEDYIEGKTYLEADCVFITVNDVVHDTAVINLLDYTCDAVCEETGDNDNVWPNLGEGDIEELRKIIVQFLQTKDPPVWYFDENEVAKTVTADDVRRWKEARK